jgi:hypothetical protein
MPDPHSVELMDERSCRWNEIDVPLSERGVRFSWLYSALLPVWTEAVVCGNSVRKAPESELVLNPRVAVAWWWSGSEVNCARKISAAPPRI